jgi:hypothetical protein
MSTINSQSARKLKAVTVSDTASNGFSAFYVGVAGNVKITDASGGDVVIPNAFVGYHAVQTSKIWSTGTDAATAVAIVGIVE